MSGTMQYDMTERMTNEMQCLMKNVLSDDWPKLILDLDTDNSMSRYWYVVKPSSNETDFERDRGSTAFSTSLLSSLEMNEMYSTLFMMTLEKMWNNVIDTTIADSIFTSFRK